MRESDGTRSAVRGRRLREVFACWGCGAAWIGLFAILLVSLPPIPTHRFPMTERTGYAQRYADGRTYLCDRWRWPEDNGGVPRWWVYVVDLPTGTLREIEVPDPHIEFRSPDLPRLLEPYTEFGGFETIDDFVVWPVTFGEQQGFHVWNWRTGEKVLERRFSGKLLRKLGRNLLIWPQAEKGTPPRPLELLEIPSGRMVPCGLPLKVYGPDSARFSPDGRFVADLDVNTDVQIRRVDTGQLEQTFPHGTAVAFSSDSVCLATLLPEDLHDRRPGGTEPSRLLQVWELATGELLAERRVELAPVADHRMAFFAADETVVVYEYLSESPHLWDPTLLKRIVSWSWKEGEPKTISSELSSFTIVDENSVHPAGKSSRFVREWLLADSVPLIDVATGEDSGTLPEGLQSISRSGRWVVGRGARRTGLQDSLVAWVRSLWPAAGDALQPSLKLTERRPGGRETNLRSSDGSATFSPDETWLVVNEDLAIAIWPVVPGRRWGAAAFYSAIVPAFALLRRWRSRNSAQCRSVG